MQQSPARRVVSCLCLSVTDSTVLQPTGRSKWIVGWSGLWQVNRTLCSINVLHGLQYDETRCIVVSLTSSFSLAAL